MQCERIPVEGDVLSVLADLGLPSGVADQWLRYTEPQRRIILVARTGADIAGAAILTSRPLASYLKIGRIWISDPGESADQPEKAGPTELALLADAEELAWESGCVVLKREVTAATRLSAVPPAGWAEIEAPLIAAPPTAAPLAVATPPIPSAQFKWRTASARVAVPYMRQTTDFTCGTAALSMILAHLGVIGQPSRAAELDLWRQATTILACDPYGIAVVATRQGLQPAVTVSTENALFLEDLPTEQERDLRRFIQGDFRNLADQAGIDSQLRAFQVGEIRDLVAAGSMAMVLVDEVLVHGEPCPHWILVHGLAGDHFIAHDPWTEVSQGESWVDAYDVPLSAEALDRIAWTGQPPCRAMLTFSR